MRGDDDDDGDDDAVDADDDLPDREDGVPGDCWIRRSRLPLRSMVRVSVCVFCFVNCSYVFFFKESSTLLHNELSRDVNFCCSCLLEL